MAKPNVWLSVSDLMTGLMVIFLFVAIAYIKRSQDNMKERQSPLQEYVDNKKNLHDKLVDEFQAESNNGQITIRGDLTMRFENAETLFPSGGTTLTPEFKEILSDVIPRYLRILLNDSMRDKIREIRIEGHTDDAPFPGLDPDPYMANLILSQRRATNVMRFLRDLPEVKAYSEEERRLLEYWFTANGFSYGRAFDQNKDYALLTGNPIARDSSRRVEFRLVTAGEEVLESFIEQKDGNE
jgi:outer membrane protein OmpA-like peptidoglycan-associated protein